MGFKATISALIGDATAAGRSMLTAASAAAQKTVLSLVKGDVGLGNVDNTSDANKPISTAQQTAFDAKADLIGGVVPSAQIPAIAITEYLGSVASQVAMLALVGDRGDWCLRTDTGTTFVLSNDDSSLLASWVELNYPTAPVTSVNGETGAVTLSASDVGAAATSHSHAQSDVTNLTTDLAAKAASATTISAGTGLTGGGSLAANQTISLANTAVTPGSYTATNLTVDAQGRIIAAANGSGGSPGGSSGQLQYNNAGAFGGTTAMVYAGSGTLVTVTSQSASDVPICAKGAAGQSGNLFETRNSSNTVLTAITSAGDILCSMLRSSTNSTTSAIYVAEGLRKRWELSGAEQNQYMTTGCAFDGGSNWILIGGGGSPSYAPGSSTHRVSLDITNRIMYLGTNLLASPLAYTLAGTGGTGTNIAGGKLTVAAGRSTGNATPAVVALASTTAGSSGTTLQTLRDGLQIDGNVTAAETPLLLLDIDKGTLQRVSIGAADSAGTGFKVLRVPN